MARMRVDTGDGIRLSVRVHGPEGAGTVPTVVCVHGYPDNSSVWDGVVAELSDRYRVVVYDTRGAGESDKPRGRDAYRLDLLAADLAAVVEAVSPEDAVHLLAHDWGSIQAWHAVTGNVLRGRVASFTSMSGPSLDYAGEWFRSKLRPSPRALGQALRQMVHSTYIGFFQLPVLPELVWRTGLMSRLVRLLEPAAARPALSDGLHGLQLYRANMLPALSRPAPRTTEVPVQVLAPEGDRFVGVGLQTEIGRWVPNLWVRPIAGTHWVPRSRPAVVARATAELVEHIEGAPPARGLRRSRVRRAGQVPDTGKLAVVTGGGSGIGRAIALALAARGSDVVVADVDDAGMAETARRIRELGVLAGEYTVDCSDGAAMHDFAARVRDEYGVADIVVNNAGIGMAGSFQDTTAADWERVIDVNLWGVIHGCRAFVPQLVERGEGGRIVNLASMAAYVPSALLPAYSTTKAAVLMLSECLRAELAGHGIGVTAVCPGVVHTNITATTRFAGAGEEEQAERQRDSTRLYARRGFGPDRVARDVLRAIERDKAVAPSTPEAKVGLVLSRLTPGLLRAGARAVSGGRG
jgi:NAD(P)-dependent dehydrogenase (short-subunit alcohol dehydrogenase family)/pimeloyl-ACP methyl ester carboxylesterase